MQMPTYYINGKEFYFDSNSNKEQNRKKLMRMKLEDMICLSRFHRKGLKKLLIDYLSDCKL
jgi:hypothetical protein